MGEVGISFCEACQRSSQNLHPETPWSAKVVIVDDHPMMREALRTLIIRGHGLAVCGEAAMAAIRRALAGRIYLRPEMSARVVKNVAAGSAKVLSPSG
jgi:hypothetical protein